MIAYLLAVVIAVTSSSMAYAPEVRTRIAVIDSGITVTEAIKPYLCESGHKDLTGAGLEDHNGHGTNIAAIVAKGIDRSKQCIVIVKWYDSWRNKLAYTEGAIDAALDAGAVLVNMSYGGGDSSLEENRAVRRGLTKGVTFVMAAGNNGQNLSHDCNYFPACEFAGVKNVYVVGALDKNDTRAYFSNYGKPVNAWALGVDVKAGGRVMSGTSQATANVTARLTSRMNR